MKRYAVLVFCALSLVFVATVLAQENITITTYYPSPYGSYNQLTTYNTTYLAVTSGNVGIGAASAAYKLEIAGGDVNTTAGGYRDSGACVAGTCASDIRLKQNIVFLSGALDKISQLNPISFEFIDSKFGQGRQYGLSAQDVEKVLPEIVKSDNDGIKKVRYGLEIQMYMLEAIKELKAENEQLRNNNADLEKRISTLERVVDSLLQN